MPVFEYKAPNAAGKNVTGLREADSPKTLRATLRRAGNPTVVYKAQGCPACQNTGYQGRTGIYELMLVDDDVRALILKSVDSSTIKRAAVEHGMLTLLQHGAYKVARGITSAAEVLSVTAEDVH